MAATLLKLVIEATTTTTTDINPVIYKYFYKVRDDERDNGTLVIPAAQFLDDDGNAVTTIETVTPDNGYYLLFINGVLQQSGLFTVDSDDNEVIISDADEIKNETVITLVVNNFAATSDSTTTIET